MHNARALDLSATQAILWRLVKSGKIKIEDLDTPSESHQHLLKDARKNSALGPSFIPALKIENLLREPNKAEAVELSSPRDFEPMAKTTSDNEGRYDAYLLPKKWPSVPSVSNRAHIENDKGQSRNGTDRGNAMVLGATGQHDSSSLGVSNEPKIQPQPTTESETSCPW